MNPSPNPPDPDLLSAWSHRQNEAAFRALVERYAGLVRMTAWRTCGDDSLAAEAAQLTFITLAQKARNLGNCATLAGWLHRTAMLHAKNLRRKDEREIRKRHSFRDLFESQYPTGSDAWLELSPVLDEALSALPVKEREALFLRFYCGLSIREVAATLGISPDAARKRLDRATDRLREKLARSGVIIGGKLAGVMLAGFTADIQASASSAELLISKAVSEGSVGTVGLGGAHFTPALLKASSVGLPVAILIGSGIWLSARFQSIAALETGNARLESSLASLQEPTSATGASRFKSPLARIPVDWPQIARLIKEDQLHWQAPLRATAPLEADLDAMDQRQLLEALDEIEAATLTENDRELLETRIAIPLALSKDGHRLVMDRFGRRSGNWQWTLAHHFKNWFDAAPAEALDWLRLNAPSMNARDQLVSQMVIPRLATDPVTAHQILTTVPENERLQSLGTLEMRALRHDPDGQIEWANLVRRDLPENDRLIAISWPTTNWSDGDGSQMDLNEVSRYLQRIDATSPERRACIMEISREFSATRLLDREDQALPQDEHIRIFRDWIVQIEPGVLHSATGEALSLLGDHELATRLALDFHAENPSDELLVPLLKSAPEGVSQDSTLALIARLRDPTLRQKYLRRHQ